MNTMKLLLFTLLLLSALPLCSSQDEDGSSQDDNIEELPLETVEAALSSQCKLRALYDKHRTEHALIRCRKEHPNRMKLLRKTLEKIRLLKRRDDVTWRVGLTPMADLTESEIETQYHGYNASAQRADNLMSSSDKTASSLKGAKVPKTWDWRSPDGKKKHSHVTPVQHQHEPSCWSRAAVVPLEAIMKKATGQLVALSVFEFYDCTYKGNNPAGNGDTIHAWQWLARSGRLTSQAEYPDRPGSLPRYDMQPAVAATTNYFANFKLEAMDYNDNELQLINALYEISPVVVSLYTKGLDLSVYKGKPFYSTACTQEQHHAMAAVGYTKHELIIKNSYGTGWGEKGYLLWERGHVGKNCGLYDDAIFPIVKYRPSVEKEKVKKTK